MSLTPWRVNFAWEGETVVCIGGGPSLTQEQIDLVAVSMVRVIGVNDAYRLAPWCDCLYGCDLKWWEWHQDKVFQDVAGELVTTDKIAPTRWPRLRYLPGRHEKGLSWDRDLIHYGHNGGYQAVNIAALSGAARIVLLGYDHRPGDDGRAHWFGDHPDRVRSSYANWVKDAWPTVPPSLEGHNCEVINCTPESAITAFPQRDLVEVLGEETTRLVRASARQE